MSSYAPLPSCFPCVFWQMPTQGSSYTSFGIFLCCYTYEVVFEQVFCKAYCTGYIPPHSAQGTLWEVFKLIMQATYCLPSELGINFTNLGRTEG